MFLSTATDYDLEHDEIASCAYVIWEREGRPEGCDLEHWFQAETQLRTCRAHDGWTDAAPRSGRKNARVAA